MAFCIHCGNKLGDDARFCSNCGTKVEEKEAVVSDSGAVVVQVEEVNQLPVGAPASFAKDVPADNSPAINAPVVVNSEPKQVVVGSCPSFPSQNAFVFDEKMYPGNMEDRVIFINYTSDSFVEFKISGYHKRGTEWQDFARVTIKKFAESNDASTVSRLDLDDCRYVAIESTNGKSYKYQIQKIHNDLRVTVLDDVPVDMSKAFQVNSNMLNSRFTDNLKLKGLPSLQGPCVFDVYGSRIPGEQPVHVASSALKGPGDGDTTTRSFDGRRISEYPIITLVCRQNFSLNYHPVIDSHDLIISVG